MKKTTYGQLERGDQFIGNPHGGWIFVKTDKPSVAIRLADGAMVVWTDSAEVFIVEKKWSGQYHNHHPFP